MRKILLATVFAIACFISTKAQSDESRFHIGVGPTVALPVGRLSHAYSFGIGGEAQGEYKFSENFYGIISYDYLHFELKKRLRSLESYSSFSESHILTGVRVYPITHFFIGARAGVKGFSYIDFAYRPEIGYNGKSIQLAFSFNSSINHGYSSNHLGLTAIYIFGKTKN